MKAKFTVGDVVLVKAEIVRAQKLGDEVVYDVSVPERLASEWLASHELKRPVGSNKISIFESLDLMTLVEEEVEDAT